jgi:hypothetical protein
MAKIVRGPEGPFLRNDDGKYTALSFTTKDVDVRVSNRLVAILCGTFLVAGGFAASIPPSMAEVLGWTLRLTHLN